MANDSVEQRRLFGEYIDFWQLKTEGEPLCTRHSRLLPCRYQDQHAMLKVALIAEERNGAHLLGYWNGEGAAKVFGLRGDAVLMERAEGKQTLAALSQDGRDEEATGIICTTIATLHRTCSGHLSHLTSLTEWFSDLEQAAATHGGILAKAASASRDLLSSPVDMKILHGDIHHGNILHFGIRGWLAIDPKGLYGERGFDYANLFCNANFAMAANPDIFQKRLAMVSARAGLPRERLLKWILAWSGLSMTWLLEDRLPPHTPEAVATLAASQLDI